MKQLTVTIDDRVLFSGEVAEYTVGESDETISVTARFHKAPGLMDNLIKLTQQAQQPGGAPGTNVPPRPTLDVVRDDEG